MDQMLVAFDGFAPIVTVMLPAGLAVAVASAVLRGSAGLRVDPVDPAVDGGLAFAALSVCFLVFKPQPSPPGSVGPDFGTDFGTAIAAASGDLMPWVQLMGNVVLLLPLAALIPHRVGWFDHVAKIALGGLALTCVIETTQFFLIPGRVASADDVLLNTIGAALGGLLAGVPSRISTAIQPGRHAGGPADRTVPYLLARVESERAASRP
ncbi:VanZ family protein [Saccharopolyspora sp. HNM0983]|uniref:VanZ family protein n=2 Tax=Saccharopolyspora montiporae TaxID=2781240 RepID=A0A929BED5_9PSEU|nr:VanZ family protein [Saccharopolyspora sp. HNM0983]